MNGIIKVELERFTEKEKEKLWNEKHLQPCEYCQTLSPHGVCEKCGNEMDRYMFEK